MGDDRLGGVLDVLAGVWSLPLAPQSAKAGVEPADDPACVALAADYWRMLPEHVLADVLRWSRLLGVALLHVRDWARDEESGRLLPRVEVWSPRHLTWDGGWKVATTDGDRDIVPGDGRWLIHCPFGTRKPTAKAPWHGVARWWLLKQYALADWGFYSNKHGTGLLVLSSSVSDKPRLRQEDRQKLAAEMRALGRNGAIVVPEGFSLNLLEAAAKTYQTYTEQVSAADTAFAIALKGSNLTTEVQGGSYAAASVHAQVDATKLRSIQEVWSTDERTQLLSWWAQLNFGAAKEAPWASRDTTPPADVAADINRFASGASAIASLSTAGYEVSAEDADRLTELLGVRIERRPDAGIALAPERSLDRCGCGGHSGPRGSQSPLELARGAYLDALRDARAAKATEAGQAACDALVRSSTELMSRVTEVTVEELLSAIDELPADADPRAALGAIALRYMDLDPAHLADTLERTLVLSQLVGRATAISDV
jgi:phage gp29-like protein